MRAGRICWVIAVFGGFLLSACAESTGEAGCETDGDCPDGQACRYGQCVESGWSPSTDEAPSPDTGRADSVEPSVRAQLEVPERIELQLRDRSQVFEVRNVGDSPVEIVEIAPTSDAFSVSYPIGDPGPPDQDRDNLLPRTVAPGASLTVRVWYDTSTFGVDRGELVIRTEAGGSAATVDLVGRHEGCLRLEPSDELDFGMHPPDGTATESVALENCVSNPESTISVEARIVDDADGAFRLESTPDGGRILPGGTGRVRVEFAPPSNGTYRAELILETNLPDRERVTIPITGRSEVPCPKAEAVGRVAGAQSGSSSVSAAPGETVVLDATGSRVPDGEIERYRWAILERPEPSGARLTPGNDAPEPKLHLDVAGRWKVELTVDDADGRESCEPAVVTIEVVPREEIYVDLSWRTPGDRNPNEGDGADLDLHYLNPKGQWNQAPYDIFWNNETGDWGRNDYNADDPQLITDSTAASAPEVIVHSQPKNGQTYNIGVYYYDENGLGPSYAKVRIYVDGTLRQSFGDRQLVEAFDFWHVGLVEWPSKNIFKRDDVSDGFPNQ